MRTLATLFTFLITIIFPYGIYAEAFHFDHELRLGVSAAKTGPLAKGAKITHLSNIYLWTHLTNQHGGIVIDGERYRVKLIEYDDKSKNQQAVKNVRRLHKKDKVHFVLAPYGTSINLAVAPFLAKIKSPQIISTSITDRAEQLSKLWPNTFWLPGQSKVFVEGIRTALERFQATRQTNNKVAIMAVANPFGLELAKLTKLALNSSDFTVVNDLTYQNSQTDFSSTFQTLKEQGVEHLLAFSYAPDTFHIMQGIMKSQFAPKFLYLGIPAYLPNFVERYGKEADNVLSIGGRNTTTEAIRAWEKNYTEFNGYPPGNWCGHIVYSSLEILKQAIEGANSLDRSLVTEYIAKNSFQTIMGDITFHNNINPNFWTMGQWQNGVFKGVVSSNASNEEVAIRPKLWSTPTASALSSQ